MTNKERLSILQQLFDNGKSNSSHLKEMREHLQNSNYSWAFDQIAKSYYEMPTDYQNTHFYDIIKDSFFILEKTIKEKNLVFKDTNVIPKPLPAFGTIERGEYYAFIEKSNDNTVIVFNNGLIKLTQRLSELLAIEWWLNKKQLITKKLQDLILRNFLDILMCYYLFSDAYRAVPLRFCEADSFGNLEPNQIYELRSSFDFMNGYDDQSYLLFETEVQKTAYLWIASHEYAHILLNHQNKSTKNETLSIENDSWKQEFDADLLGAIIAMESECSFITATGIYFALSCVFMSGFNLNPTEYPPIRMRMKNVFDYINIQKEYLISDYRIVNHIFVPKLVEFFKLVDTINNSEMVFITADNLQDYIYKKYPL
ncbi:MAG: hypothetical protein IKS17_11080 [Firmicutes bacterium]|nr:hypothetical protein [Bacillota bacterium]